MFEKALREDSDPQTEHKGSPGPGLRPSRSLGGKWGGDGGGGGGAGDPGEEDGGGGGGEGGGGPGGCGESGASWKSSVRNPS